MKVLATGDRNWNDLETIREAFDMLEGKITCLIHGAARGADTQAGIVAEEKGILVFRYPANWTQFGKGAGPIRNREMLKKNPDIELVMAFHQNLHISRGTKDMIKISLKAGKIVQHWTRCGMVYLSTKTL